MADARQSFATISTPSRYISVSSSFPAASTKQTSASSTRIGRPAAIALIRRHERRSSPTHSSLIVPSNRRAQVVRQSAVTCRMSVMRSIVLRRRPAAADRLVEIHHRDELIALGLREGVLRRVEPLLRVQHLEVVRESRLIPGERQLHGFVERGYLLLLRRPLLGKPRLRRERARDLPKRLDDGR